MAKEVSYQLKTYLKLIINESWEKTGGLSRLYLANIRADCDNKIRFGSFINVLVF